jgi:catechol 2,3-dioxygenase-like lactoylglutathione lyase family enzyme
MPKGWKVERFYHTVLNARDLQKTVDFYQNILGFKVLHDRRTLPWPKQMAPLFGLREAAGGGVLMIAPGSDKNGFPTMLDFIQWRIPQADFPEPSKVETTVPRVFAYKVDSIQKAHDELKAKGIKFTPAGLFRPETPMALVGSLFFYDPDGVLIELIELQKGARHTQDLAGANKGKKKPAKKAARKTMKKPARKAAKKAAAKPPKAAQKSAKKAKSKTKR